MSLTPKDKQRIYKSPYPRIPIPDVDLYSYLFEDPTWRTSDDAILLADSRTGTSWSQRDLKSLALRLGTGLSRLWRGDALAGSKDSGRGPSPMLPSYPTPEGVTYSVEEQKVSLMLFSYNSPSFVHAMLGALASTEGIILTLANSSYQPSELRHQLRDARAGVVFVHPELLSTLEEALRGDGNADPSWRERVFILDEDTGTGLRGGYRHYGSLREQGETQRDQSKKPHPDDVFVLCYSSGTTGLSKGVATTHRNMITVVAMSYSKWPDMKQGSDSMLHFLPMYHIFGLSNIWIAIRLQIRGVSLERFEPEKWGAAIERFKISFTTVVPPVMVILSHGELAKKYDFSSLRWIISGAAPLGKELMAKTQKLYPKLALLQGYGLTETSPITHITPLDIPHSKDGSIGVLLSNVEARLIDDEGNEVPLGERGELWMRCTSVMKGYWRNPKATNESIDSEGWFKTGDVAIIDKDSYTYIVDRKKELIKYKGFQVPPAELEALLLAHPDVNDVAVIGVYDDDKATEVPRAYVVAAGGQNVTSLEGKKLAQGIIDWVAGRVSNHKQLRGGVVLVDTIPKSPAGKILRRQLRDLASKEAKKASAGVPSKL